MMRKKRISSGIILFRYNNDKKAYECLILRQRCSDAFSTFVLGNWNKDEDLLSLFNRMTGNEKILCMKRDFSIIWFFKFLNIPKMNDEDDPINLLDVWKSDTSKLLHKYTRKEDKTTFSMSTLYKVAKEKYDTYFLGRSQRFYASLLKLNTIPQQWTFPKGRIETGETEVKCAMRELYEETGIFEHVQILPNKQFIDMIHVKQTSTSYKNIYFICVTNTKFDADLFLSRSPRIAEHDEARWVTLKEIDSFPTIYNLGMFMRRGIEYIKLMRKQQKLYL